MQVQVCAIWMEIKITINAGAALIDLISHLHLVKSYFLFPLFFPRLFFHKILPILDFKCGSDETISFERVTGLVPIISVESILVHVEPGPTILVNECIKQ